VLLNHLQILRAPESGEPLEPALPIATKGQRFGFTGVLNTSGREFPVIGGIVVLRQDLITDKVIAAARNGSTRRALFEAIAIERRSRRAALDLICRLRFPKTLQRDGSPFGTITGPAGVYFRFRYAVPNVPAIIGVLSCLKRSGSERGYVLDVGCGFAHFYRYYLRSYAPEKIVLLDQSLEALATASRFVDRRTLFICSDAQSPLPFATNVFTDITSFNAFQYLENKDQFVRSATSALDGAGGTLWLTNNWNPQLTDQFFGPARPPSEWQAFCDSEKWRIFPEIHFVDPVLRGGLVNLAVQYKPQDHHRGWRGVTLAYSNASWAKHNKFVPLNRAPKWSDLQFNSVYYRSAFRNRLIKRTANIKFWDAHKDYYGFELPTKVDVPGKMNRRTGRGLEALAEKLIMIESIGPRSRAVFAETFSSFLARIRNWVGPLVYDCRFARSVKPLLPHSLKVTAKRLLDLQRTL
jgi:SAM-dependent methyltransferase